MFSFPRLLGVTVVVTALATGALFPVSPGAAEDVPPASVTFDTPGQHAYTVPAGLTRVDVVAVGGQGATAERGGGRAARVLGTLDVTPGQVLYAVVGSSASGTTPGSNGGGAAGPSPCANPPGAGGGASDVRTVPVGEDGSAESRILVAGGGGGAGSFGNADDFTEYNESYGGNRGLGGGTPSLGGFGAATANTPGAGGAGLGGDTNGTATTGGRGQVGALGAGQGCGGGGGGGYGGGGGGAASPATGSGGGGGGGGSLVPDGYPAGMAARGEAPRITFSVPGLPARTGPLAVTLVQTFKQNDQGGGIVPWTNCPSSCGWIDGNTSSRNPGNIGGDIGYTSTQRWGGGFLLYGDFNQAFATLRAAPAGSAADLGTPFRMTYFAHYNALVRGDFPTVLAMQTLLTVQPPAGDPAVFSLRGDDSLRLDYLETDNEGACDPAIQVSATPCDDRWRFVPKTATSVASGVTWHFELLGWRNADGTFSKTMSTEEAEVTQRDLYGKLTIDTNPTTSALSVDGTEPVLTMTVAPVPQTGGTVDFTDGGAPIAGCTDVPVDTSTGIVTCAPSALSPGSHTLAGSFSGGFGYAASVADPVPYDVTGSQTVEFTAPDGLIYGDADVQLDASASSGLPVSYSSATPATCTTTETGTLHIAGAGDCTVTASQAGNASYGPAEQTRTFAIGKATLVVTAEDKTRAYGAANPPLTATITGFVNADTGAVITGTPALSTAATADSPAGEYPIDVSVAGLSAANYDFEAVGGTLTVVALDPFAACEPGAAVPAGYRLIQGTAGHNLILGTPGKDLIRAGTGNDMVAGAGESDIVCGGPGNDILDGGPGNDLVDGGPGIDFLSGGPGFDRGRDADLLTFRFGFEQFN